MTVVMIKPTNSCNLACAYCYNASVYVSSPEDLMSYETCKNALTKMGLLDKILRADMPLSQVARVINACLQSKGVGEARRRRC
jgi:molybdenum cofactor biosynthesis enzyme MoaA